MLVDPQSDLMGAIEEPLIGHRRHVRFRHVCKVRSIMVLGSQDWKIVKVLR